MYGTNTVRKWAKNWHQLGEKLLNYILLIPCSLLIQAHIAALTFFLSFSATIQDSQQVLIRLLVFNSKQCPYKLPTVHQETLCTYFARIESTVYGGQYKF